MTKGRAALVMVVLPAFNEAENIPALLEELERERRRSGLPISVLLVDDGSADSTSEVARRFAGDLPLTIERHEENRGLGEAFARGMLLAIDSSPTGGVIVCMDADDSHRPSQIPSLIEAIEAGADVAIASRFRKGARVRGVPLHRRGLSRGLSWLFRLVRPVAGVRDYSTGFRAYRVQTLREAVAARGDDTFDREGFGCMVALLVTLADLGARFVEVPVDLRYDRKRGGSKMNVGAATLHNLRILIRGGAGA